MDKTTELLQHLADQLGTTVTYLWPHLVHKTQIDWWATLATEAIVCAFLWKALVWLYSRKPDGNSSTEEYEIFWIVGTAALVISLLVFGLCLINQIAQISDVLEPEAATIERLIHHGEKH